jgi:hypothetical protein
VTASFDHLIGASDERDVAPQSALLCANAVRWQLNL